MYVVPRNTYSEFLKSLRGGIVPVHKSNDDIFLQHFQEILENFFANVEEMSLQYYMHSDASSIATM